MYSNIENKHALTRNISLYDASGGGDSTHSAFFPDDALPTTPIQAIDTGLLPPADASMIEYARINAKNVSHRDKIVKILDMSRMTLADVEGYRIRTAYRLARQMARVRGLLHGWERLQVAMEFDVYKNGLSMWNTPVKLSPSGATTGFRGIRNNLAEIDRSGNRYTLNTQKGLRAFKGSTTLPPPIPDQLYPEKVPSQLWKARLSRAVPQGYDPSQDLPLCMFCDSMELLTHQMSIRKGSPEEPWAGEYGIAGLVDPNTARLAWPTRDELILFEEELLLHIFDKVAETSELMTQRYLRQYFGFTRFESVDLVKTATEAGGVLYAEDAETQRSAILKRIDHIADKCAEACDPRAELAAITKKAQILGLTAEVENENMQTLRDAAVNALKGPEDEE